MSLLTPTMPITQSSPTSPATATARTTAEAASQEPAGETVTGGAFGRCALALHTNRASGTVTLRWLGDDMRLKSTVALACLCLAFMACQPTIVVVVPTPEPTHTPTITPTPTPTPVPTPTPTPTPLPTPTPTPTPLPTPTPTPLPTPTPTPLPTPTPTPLPTSTPTPLPTPTPTPLPTPTPTPMPTPVPTPSLTEVIQRLKQSVVRVDTNIGVGSGVIYAVEGSTAYIVTNEHVVTGASSVQVRVRDSVTYPATTLGWDAGRDLAVLSICCDTFQTVPFAESHEITTGIEVLVIGYPDGAVQGAATVTRGIISAIGPHHHYPYGDVIQTDAAINPGQQRRAGLLSGWEGRRHRHVRSERHRGVRFCHTCWDGPKSVVRSPCWRDVYHSDTNASAPGHSHALPPMPPVPVVNCNTTRVMTSSNQRRRASHLQTS